MATPSAESAATERDRYACDVCNCHHHTTAQHFDRDLITGGAWDWEADDAE